MRNVPSFHPTPSQIGLATQFPSTYFGFQQQFWDLKLFKWLHNEHTKHRMICAKRLDVLCFINKWNFSLPLSNVKRLRGNVCVCAVARKSEAPKYAVQIQVRELEQEADARLSEGIVVSIFARSKQLSLQGATHGRYFTTTKSIRWWTTSALDWIGSRNMAISRNI